MKISTLLSAVLVSGIAQATAEETIPEGQTAAVFLQPITSSSAELPPAPLAEIRYSLPSSPSDPETQQQPEVTSYEAPEFPEDTKLLRLGLYDTATKQWISSTSVLSVENFGKGYSPNFVLSVGDGGQVLGVSLRGVRIDAGQTRDFGPQAVVVTTTQGAHPELNKPIVLSPEGKKVEVVEKTFLQKYIPSFFFSLHPLQFVK